MSGPNVTDTTLSPGCREQRPCSASLLHEALELIKDAAACERMGKPAHAKAYAGMAIQKLHEAENSLLGLLPNDKLSD